MRPKFTVLTDKIVIIRVNTRKVLTINAAQYICLIRISLVLHFIFQQIYSFRNYPGFPLKCLADTCAVFLRK